MFAKQTSSYFVSVNLGAHYSLHQLFLKLLDVCMKTVNSVIFSSAMCQKSTNFDYLVTWWTMNTFNLSVDNYVTVGGPEWSDSCVSFTLRIRTRKLRQALITRLFKTLKFVRFIMNQSGIAIKILSL